MSRFGDLAKKLLHIEDSPERTALAYATGVFLGFSPFLGLHTLSGVAIAFLFNLNRVAVLLGVWSNTPWWIVPYYTVATWIGLEVTGARVDLDGFKQLFRSGEGGGFLGSGFWTRLGSQWDQLVGTQQQVVLERGLIDLGDEGVLVLAVRAGRVQVFGALGEGAVGHVGLGLASWVGIVPGTVAAATEQQGTGQDRAPPDHPGPWEHTRRPPFDPRRGTRPRRIRAMACRAPSTALSVWPQRRTGARH